MVRVIHLESGHEWVWSREKFLNRKFVMQVCHFLWSTDFLEFILKIYMVKKQSFL